MKRSIEKLRHDYGNCALLESSLHADPIQQFSLWLEEAIQAEVFEPNGMTLATTSTANHPSTRIVLLKKVSEQGFCFFSNYESRKGEHLRLNPFAALTFWWKEIYRAVNIEGKVKKMTRKESEAYFYQRPKGAQLAAKASHQSVPLASRDELEEVYDRLQKEYRGKKLPCPRNWGGYCLVPERIEFWQGRENRLHDRFVYVNHEGEWTMTRLSP